MSQDDAVFNDLVADYFKQWGWFLQNTGGGYDRCPYQWNEADKREFADRQNSLLDLVDKLEATPLPYYFCWIEAEPSEHDELTYQLDPGSLICIRVDGMAKRKADIVLGAAAHELRSEMIEYDPDTESVSGKYCALSMSVLDFVFLHRHADCDFHPKHLEDLFAPCPSFFTADHQIDFDSWETWKDQCIDMLNKRNDVHTARLRSLSPDKSFGDRFLASVLKLTESRSSELVEDRPSNESEREKNPDTKGDRTDEDHIDNSVRNDSLVTNTGAISNGSLDTIDSSSDQQMSTNTTLDEIKSKLTSWPTDDKNGDWIMVADLVQQQKKPSRDSLRNYRSKGDSNDDNTFGKDIHGRIWAYAGDSPKIYYLKKSLPPRKRKKQ